ncbi:hypothetical protein Tco_0523607 [Tanacetum coccineum]
MKRLFKTGRSTQVVSSEDKGLVDQEDASKQGRKIDDIDKDAEVTLVDETQGRYDDAQMFDLDVFNGEEVFVAEKSEKVIEEIVSTAKVSVAAIITTEEITLAQTLAALNRILLQEQSETRKTTRTTTKTTTPITSSKDKGKGIMVEEPLKIKPKDQVLFNEQDAIRLQAQFDEEERIAREKEEVNDALIAQWNDIQDKVETDYELAQWLQAEEQEELQLKKRWKPKDLKNNEIREEESSSTRAGDKLEQEPTKKQKVDDDKEREDLQQYFELVTEEDVAINAIPLATKPAPIVNFQIHKKGRNGYYEIMRADGSTKTYLLFSQLLKEFDKEDLENLLKLVKAKHVNTRLEEGYERVLWGNLKSMFEHHIEDEVWRSL